MNHLRTAAVLKRFAAHFPDKVFGDELTTSELMHLQDADPDLAMIASGRVPAAMEAAILGGEFADSYTAPTAEQVKSQRVQEILSQRPGGEPGRYAEDGSYIQPKPADMSLMLELASLDQAAYQSEELRRNPPAAPEGALSADGAAFVRSQMAQAQVESLNHAAGLVNGVG